MQSIASDCRLSKCCFCVPVRYGVYMIGFFLSVGLIQSVLTPLLPVKFFQELKQEADANMWAFYYLKAALELMTIICYACMLFKDSKTSRGLVLKSYLTYVVVVTILAFYMALFPSKSSQLLDDTAIEKYCQELSDADFANEDDCLRKASLHFRRNELIFINVQLAIQVHFIHVIWSHLKNSDLPRS